MSTFDWYWAMWDERTGRPKTDPEPLGAHDLPLDAGEDWVR